MDEFSNEDTFYRGKADKDQSRSEENEGQKGVTTRSFKKAYHNRETPIRETKEQLEMYLREQAMNEENKTKAGEERFFDRRVYEYDENHKIYGHELASNIRQEFTNIIL